MTFAYAFEAKSIQSWILSGGKLRDIAGASHLLDRLCAPDGAKRGDRLESVLGRSAMEPAPTLARRAGGALVLIHPDEGALARFRALWRAAFAAEAPGLDFADALSAGPDEAGAIDAARRAMAASTTPAPDPIAAGPFTMRDPRTGRPAASLCRMTANPIDAAISVKRRVINQREDDEDGGDPLGEKFAPEGADIRWPFEMEHSDTSRSNSVIFPFESENRTVGVMHADGNGLGAALTAIGAKLRANGLTDKRYAEAFERFSRALAFATRAAAEDATRETMVEADLLKNGVAPCRPVLLGGDDLTAILRGDVALPFTAAFLRAFEARTEENFADLAKTHPTLFREALPAGYRFSAGAGIVFVGASQPFSQACTLAEDVARRAKTAAKSWAREADPSGETPAPSLVGFCRVTGAAIPQTLGAIERELTTTGGEEPGLLLTAGPYHVCGAGETAFPKLEDLDRLAATLQQPATGKGAVRRLSAAFFDGAWRADWDRILSVTREADAAAADNFARALAALCGGDARRPEPTRPRPYGVDPDLAAVSTPLLDALSLLAARRTVHATATAAGDAS